MPYITSDREIHTRETLDRTGVGRMLVMTPDCHPAAGLNLIYDKDTGYVSMVCAKCAAPMGSLLVAAAWRPV